MDLPQKQITAHTYGLATKTKYCTDLWTSHKNYVLHRLMDTAQTYGHCTDLLTLHRLMDTVHTYGHFIDLWTLHILMDTA